MVHPHALTRACVPVVVLSIVTKFPEVQETVKSVNVFVDQAVNFTVLAHVFRFLNSLNVLSQTIVLVHVVPVRFRLFHVRLHQVKVVVHVMLIVDVPTSKVNHVVAAKFTFQDAVIVDDERVTDFVDVPASWKAPQVIELPQVRNVHCVKVIDDPELFHVS